jgi:hypothetical protein
MKIPTVVLLLVTLTLAGCVSEGPEGRTVIEAVAEADKIAAGVLEEPIFLYAVAAEGPRAVEIYEQWIGPDTATAPFDFELDVTGGVMKEGLAMSWVILYESQVNGQLAMVHVGETKGSKLLEHMDDGHTHMAGLGTRLGGEGAYCDTSPELKTDSDDFVAIMNADSTSQEFHNQTPPDTRFYFLFAEGSCFNTEIVHWMGFLANKTALFGAIEDGQTDPDISLVSPGPEVIFEHSFTFTEELSLAGRQEVTIPFEIQVGGEVSVQASYTYNTPAPTSLRIEFEMNGQRTLIHEAGAATSDSKFLILDLEAGSAVFIVSSDAALPLGSADVNFDVWM